MNGGGHGLLFSSDIFLQRILVIIKAIKNMSMLAVFVDLL